MIRSRYFCPKLSRNNLSLISQTITIISYRFSSNCESENPDFATMQFINNTDAFAKPRVTNYLKRFNFPTSGFASKKLSNDYANQETQNGTWYRCETRIPIFLPSSSSTSSPSSPERVATAVGFGKTEKEAENACAMHAERILDAAGAELFSLGTMQARHAEAAIKEGRWARFPKNHPKRAQQDEEAETRRITFPSTPPLICSPSPISLASEAKARAKVNQSAVFQRTAANPFGLRNSNNNNTNNISQDEVVITLEDMKDTDESELQHEGIEIDKAEFADWRIYPHRHGSAIVGQPPPSSLRHLDESEGGKYWLVEFGMFYQNEPLTLLSPHVFCAESLDRVKKYFEYYHNSISSKKFEESIETATLPLTAWASERLTLFKKTIKIPVISDDNNNKYLDAIGVSKEEETAISLAAMHAEILIDYHGLSLFPYDEKLQAQHADECRKLGRWATTNTISTDSSSLPSPTFQKIETPLGILEPTKHGLREWGESTKPKGARQFGRSVQQIRRVASMTEEEYFLHCHARNVRPYHLLEFNPEELFADGKGEKMEADLRQLMRDLGERRELYFLNYDYGSMWRCTLLLPLDMKTFGIRGGYALGFTQQEARYLAVYHCIETLCTFGLPLYLKDKTKQLKFEEERQAAGYFVVKRDPATLENIANIPSPKVRSPPGFRSTNNWRKKIGFEEKKKSNDESHQSNSMMGDYNSRRGSPIIRTSERMPPYNDWRAAQMIDASVFTVIDTSRDYFDKTLVIFLENYLRNVESYKRKIKEISAQQRQQQQSNEKSIHNNKPLLEVMQYFGLQPVKGHFLVSSNTVFASIPLPPGPIQTENFQGATSIFAVGRDEDRRQALKNLYIHAMRIIESLGLVHLCCTPEGSEFPKNSENAKLPFEWIATSFDPRANKFHDVEQIKEILYKQFDQVQVAEQTVLQEYGAAASYTGQKFTWGNPFSAVYPPLYPVNDKRELIQSGNMMHVPCPCMGTIISERCWVQTNGRTKHMKMKCA